MARRNPRQRPFWAAARRRERRARQMAPLGLPTPLRSVSSPSDNGAVRVLGSGDIAFQHIIERVRSAERSVEIRAFLWRDDEAGNMLGEAVLAAANRGARVTIHKDKIAAVYELSLIHISEPTRL